MKYMGLNELREKYLSFFESKGHLRMNSFPLVPKNDKSLLLINAGMAPLKPYFTGQEVPPRRRVTTCQKCIRTGDIENVGKTARHGTFFEMLGNFSFGDYFKNEAITWSWEFCTKVLEMEPEKIYVTVYKDDDEAEKIWHEKIGVPMDHIFRMGKEDNFWEHGSGPCGPCSELYYDRGEEFGCGKPGCTVGCDCDRYMEFWNNVFTQFDRQDDGSYLPLEHKNIDTGMGLERLATLMQGVTSIFDVDTIKAIRDHVCRIAGVEYGKEHEIDVSVRVITDHIRSMTFMTSDGVLPSNEGRGYVLRRLLRRAARHGKLLGISRPFLAELSSTVIANSKEAYPELEDKKEYIFKVLHSEEEKFYATLDSGLEILQQYIAEDQAAGQKVLSGSKAFKLYDTYGFPMDLTKEIAEEAGMEIDEEGFREEMEVQRVRARSAREEQNYMGAKATVYNLLDPAMMTEFVGYDRLHTDDSQILAITTETEVTDQAGVQQEVTVFTDHTPFYATSGGQHGDCGTIRTATGVVEVETTKKAIGDKIGHVGRVTEGYIEKGQKAVMDVNAANRLACARNHSATHLLQKALRNVLGSHVEQAGSDVTADRLRFDFTHFQAMSAEELEKVENEVNQKILEGLPIHTEITTMEEARKKGAMALFGEKYGDHVRMVCMGDYSMELCGGTHLSNTAQAGCFKLLSEGGVAAGVRRIEAVTGEKALEYFRKQDQELTQIAQLTKVSKEKAVAQVQSLVSELKELQKELESLKAKMTEGAADDILKNVQEVEGIKLLAAYKPELDAGALRQMGDTLKNKLGSCVVMLAGGTEKLLFVVMATEDAVKAGAHAGNIVRTAAQVTGGNGGGRPNMAQAGGKDVTKVQEALEAAKALAESQLKH